MVEINIEFSTKIEAIVIEINLKKRKWLLIGACNTHYKPLLFLICINDLEIGIKSHIKFFADDTSLFSIVGDPNTSACEMNYDLKLISQWALQWKMSFNPDPTKQAVQVLFSRKTRKIAHPEIFFNDTQGGRIPKFAKNVYI